MTNKARIDHGKQLLELFSRLEMREDIDEDTVTDSISDIVHAAISMGIIKNDGDGIFNLLGRCWDHVDVERDHEVMS
jgi:hypothetical protein